MYKIYERVVPAEDVELTNKITNGPIELGRGNKREQSGNITGYCDTVIENEGKLIEFRVLVPDFDTSGRMKKFYIPEWRIHNTFNFKAEDVKGKYITLSGTGANLKIEKIHEVA